MPCPFKTTTRPSSAAGSPTSGARPAISRSWMKSPPRTWCCTTRFTSRSEGMQTSRHSWPIFVGRFRISTSGALPTSLPKAIAWSDVGEAVARTRARDAWLRHQRARIEQRHLQFGRHSRLDMEAYDVAHALVRSPSRPAVPPTASCRRVPGPVTLGEFVAIDRPDAVPHRYGLRRWRISPPWSSVIASMHQAFLASTRPYPIFVLTVVGADGFPT